MYRKSTKFEVSISEDEVDVGNSSSFCYLRTDSRIKHQASSWKIYCLPLVAYCLPLVTCDSYITKLSFIRKNTIGSSELIETDFSVSKRKS